MSVDTAAPQSRSAWAWIPTLYFAQGIPYVVVMTMSVIMYKRLGVSNADIALYTSWLYLPWVIKPLWSPVVELLGTKRQWIVFMQLAVGAALGAVALTLPGSAFFRVTLGIFWLLAFASATHDIAADGFYMLALNKHDQAWFVGVRSTFYRLAMIAGQGLLIMLAGAIETRTGLPPLELELRSAPGAAAAIVPADPIVAVAEARRAQGASGPLQLFATPAALTLDSAPMRSGEVNDLVARARAWNAAHGFSGAKQPVAGTANASSAGVSNNAATSGPTPPATPSAPSTTSAPSSTAPSTSATSTLAATVASTTAGSANVPSALAPVRPATDGSWWTRAVSHPLASFLRSHFGAATASGNRSDVAGRAGVFLVSLSSAPAKDVVVTLGRDRGDNGVKLLEGERFVFHPSNWDQPVMVVVQLDPKNSGASEAVFVARAGNIPLAWAITFTTLAGLFVLLCAYHRFVLPKPASDVRVAASGPRRNPLREFFGTFGAFFRKPMIVRSLAFLLLYRLAEAQLVKIASLFLLDAREAGGLGLSTSAVGFVYGTVGVIALTLGGLLGGFVAARQGLKFWLPFMVCAIHLPNLVFVYLAFALPTHLGLITAAVAVEQFGYGFGFSAYMIYMLYIAQGQHQTAHYAICTGFMALGMMIPGMFTGWAQEIVGYQHFFVWIMICTIPGFLVTALIRPDPEFGKKAQA